MILAMFKAAKRQGLDKTSEPDRSHGACGKLPPTPLGVCKSVMPKELRRRVSQRWQIKDLKRDYVLDARLGLALPFRFCGREGNVPVTIWIFIFAGISALADLIGIIRVVMQSDNTEERKWYRREVHLTAEKLVVLLGLGSVSLGLSAFGLYRSMTALPVITLNASIASEWGGSRSPSSLFVTVNTSELKDLGKTHRLMFAALIVDPTMEAADDNRIIKSGTFEIRGDSMRLEMNPSEEFWKRAQTVQPLPGGKLVQVTRHKISLYLIAWPKFVSTDRLKVLSDVDRNGGKILGTGGFI